MTDLEQATEALRKRIAQHDAFEAARSERRGSVPPPPPPIALSPERVEQIGKAMLSAANLISAFNVGERISPAELLAYHESARRGAKR